MVLTRKAFLRGLGGAAAAGGLASFLPRGLAEASQKAGAGVKRPTIETAEVFTFTIPQRVPMKIALGTPLTADNVLVRLRTIDGVTGLGESAPYSAVMGETQASDLVLGKSLAGIVKGRDPFALPQIVEAMDAFSPQSPGIKAAFEMAIWDICGKIAGLPVYRLLGAYRESFETDQTVYLETPEVAAEKAAAIAAKGFRNVKIKLGEAPETDIARIKAVRAAVGPRVGIRVDANQGWSVPAAIKALRGVEPYDLQFCEQPVPYWDWAGMRQIRASVAVPLMADESIHYPHDVIAGVRQDAMDMINIKLMKSGGILQAVRTAEVADASNLSCMLGCMSESRLALTAAAHVMMSQRQAKYADLDAFLEHDVDPIVGGMQVKAGVVTLPDAPGLGLDVDPAFFKKLTQAV
ncbi:MAG: dipeptide epimerase [Acidobacteria bacterium]|nr:MAG: dipeptide epimerase [Acidobacteriota bacterium]